MTAERAPLCLAIDTASDIAGVALTQGEELLAESTWRSRQNHSRQLLPTVDWLLSRAERAKEEIGAVFVCTGPGSYSGLRVGLSTAKTLAFALEIPLVGIGRLLADAWPVARLVTGRVIAVHAAGRADLAWAAYERDADGEIHELSAPRLSRSDELAGFVSGRDFVTFEAGSLPRAAREALAQRGATIVDSMPARALAVAELGRRRLLRGEIDNPDTLVPLCLRAPAIGPQNT